jgi:hypothetical protein
VELSKEAHWFEVHFGDGARARVNVEVVADQEIQNRFLECSEGSDGTNFKGKDDKFPVILLGGL